MPVDPTAERERLHGYIVASQRVQRRLGWAVVALAAAGVGVLVIDRTLGALALLGAAIVGVCGFWVTAAHIADWRMRLRGLTKNAGRPQKVSRQR